MQTFPTGHGSAQPTAHCGTCSDRQPGGVIIRHSYTRAALDVSGRFATTNERKPDGRTGATQAAFKRGTCEPAAARYERPGLRSTFRIACRSKNSNRALRILGGLPRAGPFVSRAAMRRDDFELGEGLANNLALLPIRESVLAGD